MRLLTYVVVLLLIASVLLGLFQYKKTLKDSIEVVASDVALDIATAQLLSAQKRIETIKKFGYFNLKVFTHFDTIPSECNLFCTTVKLHVDGKEVGYIYDSPEVLTLIKFVTGSTYLVVVFLFVLLLVIGGYTWPLTLYKRDVQNFINSASTNNLENIQANDKDSVTSKILSIMVTNIENAKVIQELNFQLKEKELISNIARQVAHDVRSPLSVLNLVIQTFKESNNFKDSNDSIELLNQAINRINSITEDLLSKSRKGISNSFSLSSLLESIVKEKQYLLGSSNLKINLMYSTINNADLVTIIEKSDIERIVSNIINNSIESLESSNEGFVKIELDVVGSRNLIKITDNGHGMTADVLSKVCSKGFTFGKSDGNGLGLYHAKSTIESAGGVFRISSEVGVGTVVEILI
ncbi:MAG: sensor histidine kinase [Pseudobdellovibrio sp.]